MRKYIMLSGGIDPLHVGHVRMIEDAATYGNVIIALNSDAWLLRKKGYIFMPYEERREILLSLSKVYGVIEAQDEDDTVCATIEAFLPDYFGNGGDRKSNNTPEVELCHKLGIELVWNLGGEKIQSSSELVAKSGKSP